MSPRWMLRGLRWTYCVFIAAASITAAGSTLHGLHEGSLHPQMILALAGTEAVAAVAPAIGLRSRGNLHRSGISNQ